MKTPEKTTAPARPGFSFDTLLEADHSRMPVFMRLVREFVLPRWPVLLIALGSMVANAATAGIMPFLLQKVGDEVFVNKNAALLYLLPALIVLTVAIRAVSSWVSTVTEGSIGTRVVAEMRFRMFDTIAAADLAWVQGVHSGRFVSVFVNDSNAVDRSVVRVLSDLIKNGLSFVFLMGAMFYMDWRLSIIVLIGAPFAIVNLGRQRKRIRQSAGRSIRVSGDLNSVLTQTLQSMRVVKAYGQEATETKRLRTVVLNLRKYFMRTTRTRAAVGPLWETLMGLGFAAGVFYGGYQGIQGNVTLGQFMGFMTAALLVFAPMKALANVQATLAEGLLATERVFALIDYSSHVVEERHAQPLKVTAGAISFRDVTFAYDEAKPVLRGLDVELPAGKTLALVGPSGAGKSTVLNLILRLFDPQSGVVAIDGQDLKHATIASVRGASALLTQDPVLFDDTIAANISYGSEGASDEEIAAAAKAAAAHDFIMRLPEGYQTRVGEAGNRLSGGERQRVAFARAMLRNTPILLLDEPTSALDAESEAKVQAALERLIEGRTVVMIAHRLSTVQRADRIFYMEDGRIVEAGTHAELVARRGRYARMVQTQLLGDEPQAALAGG
jgi:subfamily B ATP-binding cassette protein MsbA